MRKKTFEATGLLAGLIIVALIVACLGLSWIITCGIIKLITLCFGWTFSWGVATGIWLIMCLLSRTFKTVVKK